MKISPQISVDKEELVKFWEPSASGSGSRNFLKDSSTLRDRAFFHNLAYNFGESGRILVNILSQTSPWTSKTLLNFESNPGSGSIVRIRIRTPDADHILVG